MDEIDRVAKVLSRRKESITKSDWDIFTTGEYGKFKLQSHLLAPDEPLLDGFSRNSSDVDVFLSIFNSEIIKEIMELIEKKNLPHL